MLPESHHPARMSLSLLGHCQNQWRLRFIWIIDNYGIRCWKHTVFLSINMFSCVAHAVYLINLCKSVNQLLWTEKICLNYHDLCNTQQNPMTKDICMASVPKTIHKLIGQRNDLKITKRSNRIIILSSLYLKQIKQIISKFQGNPKVVSAQRVSSSVS